MNNITFGQYIPGDSWIYKLDPRLKIILTILYIVLIFLLPNLISMAIGLGLFALIFISTRISIFKWLKSMKPVMFLLLFTIILQLVYSSSDNSRLLYSFDMQIGLYSFLIMLAIVIVYFCTKKFVSFKFLYLLLCLGGIFSILWLVKFDNFIWSDFTFNLYQKGLENALFIFIRIILMIGVTALLTFSTMSTDINNGLEAVLSPLKLIKIPVGIFSMLISLTLRFIPTLLDESKKIMNAQASRGVDFNEGSLKAKVNQIISLLIPMFVISFKRADDLANAMEARGYIVGGKRTKLDELKLRWRDYTVMVITILIFTGVILYKIYV